MFQPLPHNLWPFPRDSVPCTVSGFLGGTVWHDAPSHLHFAEPFQGDKVAINLTETKKNKVNTWNGNPMKRHSGPACDWLHSNHDRSTSDQLILNWSITSSFEIGAEVLEDQHF